MHDTLLSELLLLYMLLVISMWMGERQTSVISNCCFSILLFAVLCIRTRSKKKRKKKTCCFDVCKYLRGDTRMNRNQKLCLCVCILFCLLFRMQDWVWSQIFERCTGHCGAKWNSVSSVAWSIHIYFLRSCRVTASDLKAFNNIFDYNARVLIIYNTK